MEDLTQEQRFLNVSQVLINHLKGNQNINKDFLFSADEAHLLIRCLDLFCDSNRFYVSVGFYGKYIKDTTIHFRIHNKSLGQKVDLFDIGIKEGAIYHDPEVEKALKNALHLDNNLLTVPEKLRQLMLTNFL